MLIPTVVKEVTTVPLKIKFQVGIGTSFWPRSAFGLGQVLAAHGTLSCSIVPWVTPGDMCNNSCFLKVWLDYIPGKERR